MNCRPLLVWLVTVALVVQGMPSPAVMVGCSMGASQAACSRWINPSEKTCCCQGGPIAGMACCRKNSEQASIKELTKVGCRCEFTQLSGPVQTLQPGCSVALVSVAPAILPDRSVTIPAVSVKTDPWITGSDS